MTTLSTRRGDPWGLAHTLVPMPLLLGLFLPGWTAAEVQSPAAGSGKATAMGNRGQGAGPELVWLKIMAFTDAPVVGADVRVNVRGSQR